MLFKKRVFETDWKYFQFVLTNIGILRFQDDYLTNDDHR